MVGMLPGTANAATSTFSGTVNNTGWTTRPTVYTATSTSTSFDPNGLICPSTSGTGCYLAARLINTAGFVISTTAEWRDNYSQQSLNVNTMAIGTRFRFQACCWQGGPDHAYGGTLRY